MADEETGPDEGEPVDLAFLRRWIGREQYAKDILAPRVADSLRATLEAAILPSGAIPASIHWCLAPPVAPQSELGADGHPGRGDFLPPVPLPRRMWAGSDVEFLAELQLMDTITRRSRVEDVEMKHGRSGPLVFVTVRHDWLTPRGMALRETQRIVYRPASTLQSSRPPQSGDKMRPTHRQAVEATAQLLFRFSALTFNGHRVHYDRRYAIEVEGYAGLLVHGPLQASMLLEFAAKLRGAMRPRRFSFRGVEPLLDGQTFTLNAAQNEEGLDLWCENAEGVVTMQATAGWA